MPSIKKNLFVINLKKKKIAIFDLKITIAVYHILPLFPKEYLQSDFFIQNKVFILKN